MIENYGSRSLAKLSWISWYFTLLEMNDIAAYPMVQSVGAAIKVRYWEKQSMATIMDLSFPILDRAEIKSMETFSHRWLDKSLRRPPGFWCFALFFIGTLGRWEHNPMHLHAFLANNKSSQAMPMSFVQNLLPFCVMSFSKHFFP